MPPVILIKSLLSVANKLCLSAEIESKNGRLECVLCTWHYVLISLETSLL